MLSRRGWRRVEIFLALLGLVLMIGSFVAYYYPVDIDPTVAIVISYPFRGRATDLAVGAILCFVGSFVSDSIAERIERQSQLLSRPPGISSVSCVIGARLDLL